MQFKVKAHDLYSELALAQGIADRKTTIPTLGHVLMETAGQCLKLAVSDMETSLRTSCPVSKVEADGAVTVQLQWLHNYLHLLPPDAEVSISAAAGNDVEVTRGTARSSLRGAAASNFPDLPAMPPDATGLPLGFLAKSVRKTLVSVASDASSYSYQAGCLLVLNADSATMVSTDTQRLSLYTERASLGGVVEESRCLIPRKPLVNLGKVLGASGLAEGEEGVVDFAQDENHLFFRAGHRLLACQKMTATFPDYGPVLPDAAEIAISLDVATEELAGKLRLVDQFSPQENHAVRFTLDDGELQLAAKTALSGESQASLPVEYSGERFDCDFNARSILDFLGVCDSERVSFSIKDARSAAELSVPGLAAGQQHRYVIMPVRV